MKQFREILCLVGVNIGITCETLADILERIALEAAASEEEDEQVCTLRSNRDQDLMLNILSKLSFEESLKEEIWNKLYVPMQEKKDGKSRACHISCACYNDCAEDWLQMAQEDEENIHIVHSSLSSATCKKLRISPLMSRLVDADEMFVEGFGQSEDLTQRLKTLIKEYPDGLALPKEMIQNADDAEAAEICFIWDERENAEHQTKLLSPGMDECQGPALLIYNNATFSSRDLENIIKLGGETKMKKTSAIGKFGLGFNSVYNITDVPSFITRNYVIFFDPHLKHIDKCLTRRREPGLKLDMRKNKKHLSCFSDQFAPFQDVMGCRIIEQGNFAGTLFRLPFRTRKQARESNISDKQYDREAVVDLLNMLLKSMSDLILFTQNISNVQLYHIPASGLPKDMKLVQGFKRSRCLWIERPLKIDEDCSFLSICSGYAINPEKFETTPRRSSVCKIVEESGKSNVDGLLSSTKPAQYYLIREEAGSESTLKMAQNSKNYNPFAAVALPVKKNRNNGYVPDFDCKDVNKMYCSLPLPIVSCPLPASINAYFDISFNRRNFQEQTADDRDKRISHWNDALMQDPIFSCFLHLLKDICQVLPSNSIVPLFQFWPVLMETARPSCLAYLSEAVLDKATKAADEFPGIAYEGKLITFDRIFCMSDEALPEDIYQIVTKLYATVHNNMKIIEKIPTFIKENVIERGGMNHNLSFHSIFHDYVIPSILEMPAGERNSIVKFTLTRHQGIDLKCVACIPVKGSDRLRAPSELVHPKGAVACLFDDKDDRFPHEEFASENLPNLLLKHGMNFDCLTWKDLLERIEHLTTNKELEAKQQTVIMKILEERLKSVKELEKLEEIALKFQNLKFLPSIPQPSDYPLPLFAKGCLYKPSEMWPLSALHLVSCSHPLARTDGMPVAVKKFLHLDGKYVETDDLLNQVEAVIMFDPSELSEDEFRIRNQKEERLLKVYEDIFKEVCKRIEEPNVLAAMEGLSSKDIPCILTDDSTFAKPSQFATSETAEHLPPYLFNLNHHWLLRKREYLPLITSLGCCEMFDTKCVISSLEKMNDKHKDGQLNEQAALLNASLADALAKRCTVHDKAQISQLKIVNSKNFLKPIKDLFYNDNYNTDLPQIDDAKFAHRKIDIEICKSLGIQTRNDKYILDNSQGISFGPKIELTKAIKQLLKQFPFNCSILYELIQNADDSGATSIHFHLDHQNYSDEYVLSENWKKLQGPALCVIINSAFTEGDLEAIQNIADGSKEFDMMKTGKYGIGFNSVYHLTDVPMFFTQTAGKKKSEGEVFCILDPLNKYTPGSDPGLKFTDMSALRLLHKDVLCVMPFQLLEKHERCAEISHDATIFRFPLRIQCLDEKEMLSNQIIDETTIQTFFTQLESEAQKILVFAKNLNEIKMTESSEAGKAKPQEIKFTAEVPVKADQDQKRLFEENLCAAARKLSSGETKVSSIEMVQTTYKRKISFGDFSEYWLVSRMLGVSVAAEYPESIVEAFETRDICQLPLGSVAWKIEGRNNLPDEVSMVNGGVSCTLPLQEITKLPVHMDANFALADLNRLKLWNGKDGRTLPNDWNLFLAERVLAPCYANLLLACRLPDFHDDDNAAIDQKEIVLQIDDYLKTFPVHLHESSESAIENIENKLVCSLYKILQKTQVFALFDGWRKDTNFKITWTTAADWYFLPKDEYCNGSWLNEDQNIALLHAGFKIFHCSANILAHLTDDLVIFKSPATVHHFLKSNSQIYRATPMAVGNTCFRNVNSLLSIWDYLAKYLMEDELNNKLLGLPLCLAGDKVLHVFSEQLVLLTGSCMPLFPSSAAKFINHRISIVTQNSKFVRPVDLRDLPSMISADYPTLQTNQHHQHHIKLDEKHNSLVELILDEIAELCLPKLELQNTQNVLTLSNDFVNDFGDFFLIPTTNGSLYSIKHAKIVFGKSIPIEVRKILKKLHIPELHSFPANKKKLQCLLNSLSLNDKDDVQFLKLLLDNAEKVHCLSNEERIKLRNYIQTCGCLEDTRNWKQLKQLPLFEQIDGKWVALCSQLGVITSADMSDVLQHMIFEGNAVFLKSVTNDKCDKWDTFLVKMGCKRPLTLESIFCDNLFIHWREIEVANQQMLLYFLYQKLFTTDKQYENEKKMMMSQLTNQKLFQFPRNTQYFQADAIFDDRVRLFKIMLSGRGPPELRPRTFPDGGNWREFLARLGMNCHPTAALCIQFANEVAASFPSVRDEDWVAELILDEFVKLKVDDASAANQFSNIVFIPCLPVCAELQVIHQQMKQGQLISLRGSLHDVEHELVWTTECLLPSWKSISDLKSKKLFGIIDMELLDHQSTIKNLSNLCIQITREVYRPYLFDVFNKIYKYLSNCPKVDLSFDFPWILVDKGKKLVWPNQVTLQTLQQEENFEPYIYSLPEHFIQHSSLFCKYGTTNEVDLQQLSFVMNQLKETSKGKKLNPDMTEQACQVMKMMMICLQKLSNEHVSDLLFLSVKRKLVNTSDLVVSDQKSMCQRLCYDDSLEMNVMIDSHELEIDYQSMILALDKLATSVQPQKLTEVVEEVITENALATEIVEHKTASELQAHIRGRVFLDGVKLYFFNEHGKSFDPSPILETLRKVQISAFQKLETSLMTKSDQYLVEKSENKVKFFSLKNSFAWKICILHDFNKNFLGCIALAPFLSEIIQASSPIRCDKLYLAYLLHSFSADDPMMDYLKMSKSPKSFSTLQELGMTVTEQDLSLIRRVDDGRILRAGQVVVVFINDKYVYGKIHSFPRNVLFYNVSLSREKHGKTCQVGLSQIYVF